MNNIKTPKSSLTSKVFKERAHNRKQEVAEKKIIFTEVKVRIIDVAHAKINKTDKVLPVVQVVKLISQDQIDYEYVTNKEWYPILNSPEELSMLYGDYQKLIGLTGILYSGHGSKSGVSIINHKPDTKDYENYLKLETNIKRF